ncbi:MAG: DNA-processing protein DprA [Alistipes sp.]
MTIEDVALTFVPQLGVRGVAHLMDVYGSAAAVFAASEQDLTERAELRPDVARAVVRKAGFGEAEREMQYCRRHDIRIIASTDDAYPPLLRQVVDFPHVLYLTGDVEALRSRHMLSIVGTRRMTPYGERMCNELVEGIASKFPDTVIVSGLAFGTDAAAHRAALAFGLRTVGVLANALPDVVPAHNAALGRDMLAHGGAVVAEVSSQTRQNGNLYIPRNRIVAALGEGLVVVESPFNGGSMSTAKAADGYLRPVMAVAGRATDAMSKGTNALIRNRVAQMVGSADEIIEELGWQCDDVAPTLRFTAEVRELSEAERRIMACLGDGGEAVSFDAIVARSGLDVGEASARLLDMELSGDVRSLPGKMYEKLR